MRSRMVGLLHRELSEGRRKGRCIFCGTVHAFALKDYGISWKSTARRTVV